jgi:hypothetical protein
MMTEPENSRVAMYRSVLADAFGTNDLPDCDVLEQWLVALISGATFLLAIARPLPATGPTGTGIPLGAAGACRFARSWIQAMLDGM